MRLPGRGGREEKGREGEGGEGTVEGMGCFYLGPTTSKCVATALQTQFFVSDIHGHVNAIFGANIEIRLFLHDF